MPWLWFSNLLKAGRPSFSSTQLADFSTTGSSPPQKEEKESQQQQQAPPQQPAQSSFVADLKDAAIAATGCFIGIGTLATIHYDFMDGSPYTMVLGSMGATAVLVFGAPAAPFSQPWNVVAGHLVSAVCGIAAYQYIGVPMESLQVALPVAAAASIFAMKVGKCVHPPAGGTTLIAVLGSAQIHALGFVLFYLHAFPSVAYVCMYVCMHA